MKNEYLSPDSSHSDNSRIALLLVLRLMASPDSDLQRKAFSLARSLFARQGRACRIRLQLMFAERFLRQLGKSELLI
jgi:hypothetical protein